MTEDEKLDVVTKKVIELNPNADTLVKVRYRVDEILTHKLIMDTARAPLHQMWAGRN